MDYYNDNSPYCCQVLRKNIDDGSLPNGTVHEADIRTVTAADLRNYRQIHLFAGIGGFPIGLRNAGFTGRILTAGFPCQDISFAGKGIGLDGERSGLWWETLAAIDMVRPPVVLLENVAALLARGIDAVLGSLASIGYDAQWHCIPAAYVGAPHRRDRVWIVGSCANSFCLRSQRVGKASKEPWPWQQFERLVSAELRVSVPTGSSGGVAHGIPQRVDRLKALGNAVVPQVVEYVAGKLL